MFWIALGIVLVINLICIVTMILLERKNAQSVLSWVLVMTFLPMIGFFLYCLIGNSLSIKTKKMIKDKGIRSKEFKEFVVNQKLGIDDDVLPLREVEYKHKQLIRQNLLMSHCALYQSNKIEIFTNGTDKINQLLQDIENATKSINICYYIFATDDVGLKVLDALIEKAKQGVEVNLLIDAVGSLKSNRKQFKKLVQAGGRFAEFFPPLFGFRLFNFKLNYRNHRKIVVIDNKIGYTGGINIRDDHMGKNDKLLPWTDIHIKIQGDAVIDLQKLFLGDWRFAYKRDDFDDENLRRFFEDPEIKGESGVQVVYSGPDEEEQQIKKSMIKMILSAKKSIILQTPYFVPDESFIEALKIASASGVDIKIITPKLPDKKVVYYTSLSYLRDIVSYGVKVYQREGFLHSKCLLIDNELCMIGTCNADIRSFKLNFEDACIIYDNVVAEELSQICENDLLQSTQIDKTWFCKLPRRIKVAKSFFRLFSALL
ncbi:MAG: cardiolipin synthase [Clostridia bacterium]|nr:cardiolipin synthase [Clostridia bacterium]